MKKGRPLLLAFIFALLNGIAFLAYELFAHNQITKTAVVASLVDMIVVFFGIWWFYSHAKNNRS